LSGCCVRRLCENSLLTILIFGKDWCLFLGS
jgi:hypothetical protein